MRTFTHCLLLSLIVNCSSAQTNELPEWKVTLKVVDEMAQPVASAGTWVSYMYKSRKIGLSDTNGIFVASNKDNSFDLAFHSEKAGYYSFWMQYHLGFHYNQSKWNPTQVIVLKRIISPIPMYAKRIDSQPPADNKPVGYDLMVGDWVAPHGNGTESDIIFTREYNRKSLQDYDYKLTVSFTKTGDGIQEFHVSYKNMEGSALRSPHEAPIHGYQPQLVRLNISHPGQKPIFDYDENRVYFLRVRTVLDENGNVKSALYGKIYGDFMQFSYYLNPTPNSRNMEFDPKRNLMKNLKPLEGVDAP
jgi:hypothetical protein